MASERAGGARVRYRRVPAAGVAALVTLVAVLGASGVLPTTGTADTAAAAPRVGLPRDGLPRDGVPRGMRAAPAADPAPVVTSSSSSRGRAALDRSARRTPPVPEESGTGKRVVFDMTAQRVWLVDRHDRVARTYLVSGSLTDNLDAGEYEVYSRSRDAIGIDDSGTMKFMVRFAHGERAAIGFHDIPVKDGHLVQTAAELGTPQSHGCIRQLRRDAKALWRFAPLGTEVVVVA